MGRSKTAQSASNFENQNYKWINHLINGLFRLSGKPEVRLFDYPIFEQDLKLAAGIGPILAGIPQVDVLIFYWIVPKIRNVG
jgi:hypothetical protein